MYDIIIIGGGTAGCVLASRLSSRTKIRILVIETGPETRDLEHTTLPSGAAFLHDGIPRYNCAIRGVGSVTVINTGGRIRGDKQDYDEWARVHGYDGLIHNAAISSSGRHFPLRGMVRRAWKDLGMKWKADGNDGSPLLMLHTPPSNGVEVPKSTLVSRVLLEIDESGNKRAAGVECADGMKFLPSPGGEAILAADAYRTPQVLLLSGIGDAAELGKHGIKQEVNLPEKLRRPERGLALGSPLFNDPAYIKGGPGDWLITMLVLISGLKSAIAKDKGTAPEQLDSHPLVQGPQSHIELGMLYAAVGSQQTSLDIPLDGTAIMAFSIGFLPTSRGSIALKSTNPEDAPSIDPNYYATETDRYVAREEWRYEVDGMETDEEVDKRMGIGGITTYHPAGSASMGKVVDANLRVKRVDGLRIVDASGIPMPLVAHYQIAVYAIAEQAADIILKAREKI
ncbi:FAD/NAD(P)-binding domain-containing protein [Lojkania enalia]|uniref:FAD/NAD(P)-binding domain-containing protein n=1 Tax=Lojkania enalia TaxID=147567 RepID=A0A9P4TNL7_9PLEO|nr:FAD/NAD(P)-binding domain-containing protein [Didymosphaeria enalia]